MPREIVTLQFGHYSNFVGTHLWNIQECGFRYVGVESGTQIDHDVLYREGRTLQGQTTYTPRLLLADLKGSLKTLPQSGALCANTLSDVCDEAPLEVQACEKLEPNQFQRDLDAKPPAEVLTTKYGFESNSQCVWSDFLYGRFHDRTLHIVDSYEHSSEEARFDMFPLGASVWRSVQFNEDFCDDIRKYVEECDGFQGFHAILDGANGFSGLATECLQTMQDDYERGCLAFVNSPEQSRGDETLNTALCYERLSEVSSLFVPLSAQGVFNHLEYTPSLPYHTSAIIASYIDTITLRYRLKTGQYSLSDFCADMIGCGRKAAAASLCLPFSFNKGDNLLNCLDRWNGPLTRSISPGCTIGDSHLTQLYVLRGIPEQRLKSGDAQRDLMGYCCKSVREMLEMYLQCGTFYTRNIVESVVDRLPVCTPFPQFFDPLVGTDGDITDVARSQDAVVKSVPALAGLHSGQEVGRMLEAAHENAAKLKSSSLLRFAAAGLETDELRESLDRLFDLRDCYFNDWTV